MCALQYVDVPNYSCLVLRKSLTDLKLSGALLDRMLQWMAPYLTTKEVKYTAEPPTFSFQNFEKSIFDPQFELSVEKYLPN